MNKLELLPTTFAESLRRHLAEKGWSQSDLARAVWGEIPNSLGVMVARNRQLISTYCSGKGIPEPENLNKIADVLGVPVEELAPDIISAAVQNESEHELSMTSVPGASNTVALEIRTITTVEVALNVIRLLNSSRS